MKNEKPSASYIVKRIKNFLLPPLKLRSLPKDIIIEQDVAITVRDGTILRANVFRPVTAGKYPAMLSAHPYGKDKFNRKGRLGVQPIFQYRIMNQPSPLTVSEWASWEAPDPAFWVSRGYVLVNIDLRGFGKSEGTGEVFSDQEAEDYYDCIEWAASQAWCNGKVGLNGVSYLAISQYKVAALNPPHLAAICPWEGFSDAYKDFFYPGGIREDGFAKIWGETVPSKINVRKEQIKRPLRDDWYKSLVPDLKKITVPALICGSFSDHCLHSQGSFRVFDEISSQHKWLYTHRGGKWATYYSPEALAFQQKFFDFFLKGENNSLLEVPPVRLEVRDSGDIARKVTWESAFPPASTQQLSFFLANKVDSKCGRLLKEAPENIAQTTFDLKDGKASFVWFFTEDTEIIGPMTLKLFVSVKDTTDVNLFAGIRKIRNGRQIAFEGSYGFGYDLVTHGWQKASLRHEIFSERPNYTEHDFAESQLLKANETVELNFSLLPSATLFKQGDIMRLDLQGHWFFGANPIIFGPAKYEKSSAGVYTIYTGGDCASQLLMSVRPFK